MTAPGQAAHQAETVAIAFHQAYEELAPQYGYRTREASAKPWDEVPAKNAALMVATAARLLKTGVISFAQEPLAAAIDPDKLDLLADWFDNDDAIRRRLGNPEVQADLRRWAKLVRDARAGLPS